MDRPRRPGPARQPAPRPGTPRPIDRRPAVAGPRQGTSPWLPSAAATLATLLLAVPAARAQDDGPRPPRQLSVCTADKLYDNPDPHPRARCRPESEPPPVQWPTCRTSDHFGSAFAVGGDFDGDGQPDLVVGSLSRPDSVRVSGQAWIYSHLADGPLLTLDGDGRTDLFGATLAFVPDLDGDGRDELAIGAPNAGRVYLIFGQRPGPDPLAARRAVRDVAAVILQGEQLGDGFGTSLAAGDVDGDGRADLLVGAPGSPSSDATGFPGAAYLFNGALLAGGRTGQARLLRPDAADASWRGAAPVDRLGQSLALVGADDEVPGADVLIGAPQLDVFLADGAPPAGAGYALLVSLAEDEPLLRLGDGSAGRPGRAEARLPLTHGEGFGRAVATVPDLDGDGRDELVVGAPLYSRPGGDDAPIEQGRVFVLSGADGAPLPPFDGRPLVGLGPRAQLGSSLAVVPDATGDGRPDLFAGAMLTTVPFEPCPWNETATVGGPLAGAVQLIDLTSGHTAAIVSGEAPRDRVGFALGAADLDGDGLAELFTGGMGWSPRVKPRDDSLTEVGRVYMLRGRRFGGGG